jgi:hypothetical protein
MRTSRAEGVERRGCPLRPHILAVYVTHQWRCKSCRSYSAIPMRDGRGESMISTVSVVALSSFSPSTCVSAIRLSASMYSNGRCNCTARVLRCTSIPGFVSKNRSMSSSVLQLVSSTWNGLNHVLFLPVRCLWVEKVCYRNEAGTNHSPDDPKSPANVLKTGKRNLDHYETVSEIDVKFASHVPA